MSSLCGKGMTPTYARAAESGARPFTSVFRFSWVNCEVVTVTMQVILIAIANVINCAELKVIQSVAWYPNQWVLVGVSSSGVPK